MRERPSAQDLNDGRTGPSHFATYRPPGMLCSCPNIPLPRPAAAPMISSTMWEQPNPDEIVEIAVPPIVTEGEFDAVRTILRSRSPQWTGCAQSVGRPC